MQRCRVRSQGSRREDTQRIWTTSPEGYCLPSSRANGVTAYAAVRSSTRDPRPVLRETSVTRGPCRDPSQYLKDRGVAPSIVLRVVDQFSDSAVIGGCAAAARQGNNGLPGWLPLQVALVLRGVFVAQNWWTHTTSNYQTRARAHCCTRLPRCGS